MKWWTGRGIGKENRVEMEIWVCEGCVDSV